MKKTVVFTGESAIEATDRLGEPVAEFGLIVAGYLPADPERRTRAVEYMLEKLSGMERELRSFGVSFSHAAVRARPE